MKALLGKIASLIRKRTKESMWARIGLLLSIIAVFCTTYALVLPALTLTSSSSSSVIQEEVTSNTSESVTDKEEEPEGQEVPNSEAPSTMDTTLSENTASEETTESEAGSQSADADSVKVTVAYGENTFSEKVTLQVSEIADTSVLDNKLNELLESSQQSLISSHSYDISFVNEAGAEIEPSKEVAVSMAFNNAMESSELQSEWKLYHFKGNDVSQVEDLTEATETTISQDNNENVTQVDFKTDSFSAYTIAGVAYEDFRQYIVSGSYHGDTKEVISGNGRSLSTDLTLKYDIPKDALNASKSYAIELPANTTWTTVQENQEYIGKDGAKDAFKYKFVQANGKKFIVLTFLDSYVDGSNVKITGDINFSASIGQDYRTDTGDYYIPFTDNVTITVPTSEIEKTEEPQVADYDFNSSKEGKITYNGDEAYLDYTITVWSDKGTKDVVKLKDTLTASGMTIQPLEVVSVVKSSYQSGNWENNNPQDVTSQNRPSASGTSFNLNLPKLEAKQKYTIKYRYKVSNFPAGKSTPVSNGLDIESPDLPNQHKETRLDLYRNKISKSGQYDEKTNKIKWTITVNGNKNDIAGAELKDAMIAGASDVQITPTNGASKTSTGYKFTATDGGKNTNQYTITYTTDAGKGPSSWNAQAKTFTNTAELTDKGEGSTATTTVPGGKGDTGGLTKTFEKIADTDNPRLKALTWQSTIKLPGDNVIPAGTEFEDELMGQSGSAWDTHYFTREQIDAVYNKLVSIFGEGNFEFQIYESGQQTWQYSSYDQIRDDQNYRKFKFKLTKDYTGTKDIILDYVSTGNIGEIINFDNTIRTNGFSQKAEYRYDAKSKTTKMDGSQDTDDGKEYQDKDTSHTINSNGTITWAVKVALDDSSQSVTVVDTPPAGLSLVNVEYGVRWGDRETLIPDNGTLYFAPQPGVYSKYPFTANGSVNADGSINLTITATEGTTLKAETKAKSTIYGDSIYIWYTFKTTDGDLDEDVVKAYNNKVSATLDGIPAGEDDHTQTITIKPSQKVSKTGQWNNDSRRINYDVVLNPEAQDLAAGQESYTVTDTLEYQEDLQTGLSYDLRQESVELLDSNGLPVPDSQWSWTVEKTKDASGKYKSILKLIVPNNQKLSLKYTYDVSRNVAENNQAQLTVKNTAEISGFKSGKKENTVIINWEKLSSSATASTTKSLKITKVDVANFANALAGATFEIREYGSDKVVATYETAKDGTLYITQDNKGAVSSIGSLEENKLYYVVEVKAPLGYQLPENPEPYYFYFSETNALPSNLDSSASNLPEMTNLSKQARQAYVTNEELPPTTSITVKKQWENVDGSPAERTSGTIKVTLKRVSDIDATPVDVETRTIESDGGQWMEVFQGLAVRGTNGEYYSYFVEEEGVSGYTTSYSNGVTSSDAAAEVTATSDTLTITNKANKQYNLPKTGGQGIRTLVMVGLALLGLAVLLLFWEAYKRYRGGIDLQ